MALAVLERVDPDAAAALALLQEDLRVVGAAAGPHGFAPALTQRALEWASIAFSACGDATNRAWSELMKSVDELLAYRARFARDSDAASFRRLRSFVYENSDAFIGGGDRPTL